MVSGMFLRRSLAFLRKTSSTVSRNNLVSLQNNQRFRLISTMNRRFCDDKIDKDYKEKTRNIPKYQLQPIDKFFLVLTRTMKRSEIPDEVSYEVVEKSQNRRRIMSNVFTILVIIFGSAYAIRSGKRARNEHSEDSVFERNVKRYEKLREQDREKEAAESTK